MRRARRGTARRGAALAVALATLTVAAALTAGAVLSARQTRRAARDTLARLRAATAADGALVAAVARWTPRWSQLAVGGIDSAATTVVRGVRTTIAVERLDARHVLLEAHARTRASAPRLDAERAVAIVVRLDPPTLGARGAATIGGALALLAGATVDGRDAPPAGWRDCPAPSADSVAIVASARDSVVIDATAHVSGTTLVDARAVTDPGSVRYGGETWAALTARATVVPNGVATPAPRVAAGACVVAADAWSDPVHDVSPCAAAYALVAGSGALVVRGPARGQGMLVVDGDLVIEGAFDFAGAIVVRGALHAERGALRLDGALVVGAGRSVLGPGSAVRWSRCAITRAADGVARISVMRRRSWTEVTR